MASANGDVLDFSGKAVLITGAATGIGRAVALGFASRGAAVTIGDVNEEAARETLDLVTRTGADVLFVRTNVSVEADLEKLVAATVERFGRLDCAFNNAGIVHAPQPSRSSTRLHWFSSRTPSRTPPHPLRLHPDNQATFPPLDALFFNSVPSDVPRSPCP